jgi:catechol 2,3-dioxygenase-like lactoylglutathione lyase family enzyme
MTFNLKKIQEVVVITANLKEMLDTFCNYGGWTPISTKKLDPSVILAWGLEKTVSGREALIQFMDIPFGRLRFIELKGVKQGRMRPATKLWDTGGILDIDIRMHDIHEVYNDLADRGWWGASEPMPLPVTGFVLDECLIANPDTMMIALAKRHAPPLDLPEGKKLPSHVYLSAMSVKNLEKSTEFYVKKLGFQLVNQNLIVKFPPNSPNNFGVPHNMADKFEMVLDLYSPDGTRDTMSESIECKGLMGHDYSNRCVPPNRGILSHRIEVEGIENYLNLIKTNGVTTDAPLSTQAWNGVGKVKTFRAVSPDGAWVEFFEMFKI